MTLFHFVQLYSMPMSVGEETIVRKKMVVVRVRPNCFPDTHGPQYEQYCQQKLMVHRPFRKYQQLKAGYDTYGEVFAQSGSTFHLWRMIYIGYSSSNNLQMPAL